MSNENEQSDLQATIQVLISGFIVVGIVWGIAHIVIDKAG